MDTKVRTRNGKYGSEHLPWTPERLALVKQLWAEGKSARQVVAILGGTTRNAVIGVWHRAGLRRYERGQSRAAAIHCRTPRVRNVPRRKPATAALKMINCEAPPILPPIGAHDIVDAAPGTCRFIAGDVKGAHQLCGHPGEPWCRAHRALVYAKPGQSDRTFERRYPGRLSINGLTP